MSHYLRPRLIGLKYLTMTKTNELRMALMTLLTVIIYVSASAQAPPVDPPDDTNSTLIRFDDTWTANEIQEFKEDFFCYEHWISPITETRLWQVTVDFPFDYTLPGTTTTISIIDINQSGGQQNDRIGGNGGSGLNIQVQQIGANAPTGPGIDPDPQGDCLGAHSPYVHSGNGAVELGIFDTGLIASPPDHTNYYYDFSNAIFENYTFSSNELDHNGHGTKMASIASHVANKRTFQYTGSNPNVNLNKIAKAIGNGPNGFIADMILGFETSVEEGTQIANCSWGFETSAHIANQHPIAHSIQKAGEIYGTLVVASAGNFQANLNNSTIKNYPACYDFDNILSVTSFDCHDGFTSFANYGNEHVDVAAAGYNIGSLNLWGQIVLSSGTSQSTAIVSGLAAALATHLPSSSGPFDYATIKCAIMEGSQFVSQAVNQGLAAHGGVVHGELALGQLQNGCIPSGNGGTGGIRSRSLVNEAKVFPNPTSGFTTLSFESKEKGKTKVEIYNGIGALVYSNSLSVTQGINEINLNLDLANGNYHLNFQVNNDTKRHNLMIIK